MTTVYQDKKYRILMGSVSLVENALENPNLVQISVSTDSTITVRPEDPDVVSSGIVRLENGESPKWRLSGINTRLNNIEASYIYARLEKSTYTSLLVFDRKNRNVDGTIKNDSTSVPDDTYWYIKVGTISATDSLSSPTVKREITFDYGYYDLEVTVSEIQDQLNLKLDKAVWDSVFKIHNDNPDNKEEITSLESLVGLWTDRFLSAKGLNPNSGGGGGGVGATALYQLNDVAENSSSSGVLGASVGKVLTYGADGFWYAAEAVGLDETALGKYLVTNNYAKKTDIPSLNGYATEAWVKEQKYVTSSSLKETLDKKVDITFLARVFGFIGKDNAELSINDMTSTISSIKAKFGLWTDEYLSAKGLNPNSGGGGGLGATALYQLNDVAKNSSDSGVLGASVGKVLTYGSDGFWYAAEAVGLDETALGKYLVTNNYAKKTDIPSLYGYATEAWVKEQKYVTSSSLKENLDKKVDVTFLARVFGFIGNDNAELSINDMTTTISSIKAKFGLWTDEYLSAKGLNPNSGSGGGIGATALYQLNDVAENSSSSGVLGASVGKVLTYGADGFWYAAEAVGLDETALGKYLVDNKYATQSWTNQQLINKVNVEIGKGLSSNDFTNALLQKLNGIEAGANKYSLPIATDAALGGVKIGSTLSINSSGIIEQKSGIVSAGTYTKVSVDTYGRVYGGTTLSDSDIPSLAISKINGLQTSLDNKANKSGDNVSGTWNINITGSSQRLGFINLSSTANLNDYTYNNHSGKLFYIGGSHTISNSPLGSNAAFGMMVWRTADGYTTQVVHSAGGKMLSRTHDNTNWGAWKEYLSTTNYVSVLDKRYVTNDFFARIFGIIDESNNEIAINDTSSVISSIKAKVGLWTDQYLSAKGLNPNSGGGGGASYDRLDNWNDYETSKALWVLSAKLGSDLDTRVKSLEASSVTIKSSGTGNGLASFTQEGNVITFTKANFLTSHQTLYGLTIQKNGTAVGTYTPTASQTINITVPTKLSELSNDGGYVLQTYVDTNFPKLIGGLIPSSYLPSYVDDVLEYTSVSNFPSTGETGKIYVATGTNLTYRWSGTGYVEISPSLALGETSSTAYAGNKGKANADAIAVLRAITISAGTGMSGGGNLTANRTLTLKAATTTTLGGVIVGDRLSVDSTGKISATYTYTLPTASSSVLGGVKVGTTLEISSGVLNQKSGVVTAGTYFKTTVDTYGRVTAGSNPTTLSGFGITDGVNSAPVTGSGNVITAVALSGHTLTFTKGVTAFTTLSVTGSGNAVTSISYSGATISVVKGSTFLTKSAFDDLFEKVNIGTSSAPVYAIRAKYGFYSDDFVSAKGASSGSGGGGGGLIQSVYSYSDLGKTFSNTTLTDTFNAYTINELAKRLSVVEGGGGLSTITVKLGATAYNSSNGVVSLPAYPTSLPASDVYAWAKAATKPTYAFSEITAKPTTLSDYGITDAVTLTTNQDIYGTKTFTSGTLRLKNNNSIHIVNGSIGGNATGLHWYTNNFAAVQFGIGCFTTANADPSAYIGWGTSPWNNPYNFRVSPTEIAYKNQPILHSGNYNTYAPTKTGTGASGTWAISITGNATTATTASKLGSATVGGTAKGIYLNAGVATAMSATVGNSGLPVYLNGGTITACSNTFLTSANYNNYAPSLTGTKASGTWGISITGNAVSATKLQTARVIFGRTFDGTYDIGGKGFFYGSYNATPSNRYITCALEIRENDMVASTQADDGYAPSIGFHWGGRTAASLIYTIDGFKFMNQAFTGYKSIYGIFKGNADSATKLQTARTINNTSFDGTANITTSIWGASRVLTLSGAVTGAITINGGSNVTLTTTYSTGNISALDSRYVNVSGDTMTGILKIPETGIRNTSNVGLLMYDTSYTYLGPYTATTIIRSGSTDLKHRYSDKDYTIFDARNSNVSTVDWKARALTAYNPLRASDYTWTSNLSNDLLQSRHLGANGSYAYEVILLLPVPSSTNLGGVNRIQGRFMSYTNGANQLGYVDIILTSIYNYTFKHISSYSTKGNYTLATCTYGGVKYYCLKVPYGANRYDDNYFYGTCYSTITGGSATRTLPMLIKYKTAAHDGIAETINNSEINNSLSDTVVTGGIVAVQRYGETLDYILRPYGNGEIPLGESGYRWSTVYTSNLNASGASTLSGAVSVGSTLSVSSTGTFAGSIYANNGVFIGSSFHGKGYIELYASTPYIDFHYNNSTADYTSRIIESASGRLQFTGQTLHSGNAYFGSTSYYFNNAGNLNSANFQYGKNISTSPADFQKDLFGTYNGGHRFKVIRHNSGSDRYGYVYSPMLAFTTEDTHGYISIAYDDPIGCFIGGGNNTKINWQARLFNDSINIYPVSNNTYSCGISNFRWSNVYTTALNVSSTSTFGGAITANGGIYANQLKTDPILAASYESNEIDVVNNSALSSLNHAIRFRWYDNRYQIGIVRSGSSTDLGFAICRDTTTIARFHPGLISLEASINISGAIISTAHIRTGSYISAGEYADDSYGYINVTRPNNINNASCFSMVRNGSYPFGIGFDTSNRIVMGNVNTSKVITPWITIASSITTFSNGVRCGYITVNGGLEASVGGGSISTNGGIWAEKSIFSGGAITAKYSSDRDLKCGFDSQVDYRQKIMALGPVVDFRYNSLALQRNRGAVDTKRHTGVIYQNAVKAGITGLCLPKDEDGFGSVNPLSPDLIFTVVGALQATILSTRSFESRFERMERELREAKDEIARLRKELSRPA